jgi:predicted esterase
MDSKSEIITIKDWVCRIKISNTGVDSNRILLLLHGHLGNEDSMWILARQIHRSYSILSPRAPLQTGEDRYSWHEITPDWPDINYYRDLTSDLVSLVHHWMKSNGLVMTPFDVMGFSQGAVMAYALALLQPEHIRKIAAIAGFIPSSWKDSCDGTRLANKDFLLHMAPKMKWCHMTVQSGQWNGCLTTKHQ